MIDLDVVDRLVADAGAEVWVLTEGSSPGWRVETTGGDLVCSGPGQLHEAAQGRLIVNAKQLLPALTQELRDAYDLIIQLTGEAVADDVPTG